MQLATDRLSATFSALADPTRRAILARLALGETSVSELAKPFEMSMPAVSKHLKVLEHAGLISRSRDAQMRPCKIEAQALKQADDWLEEYRRLWEQRLDRLEDYLKAVQIQAKTDQAKTDQAAAVGTEAPKSADGKAKGKGHGRKK
jgi:DNA-binding transcriptional ArsR family regulator